jgi:hypothetical protein
MYDLYHVVVRYLTFVLLAERRRLEHEGAAATGNGGGWNRSEEKIKGLAFATDGKWGEACFALLEEVRVEGNAGLLSRFLGSFDDRKLDHVVAFSKEMVRLRNDVEKGVVRFQNEREYQKWFGKMTPGLGVLLSFLKPLAGYPLVNVTGVVERHGGRSKFQVKHLKGSNPLFAVEEVEGHDLPDTGCVLDCGGAYLPLYPWLQLDYCKECLREMVFVYDRMDKRDGSQIVVLREYPTNHQQDRGDLTADVREGLGLRCV